MISKGQLIRSLLSRLSEKQFVEHIVKGFRTHILQEIVVKYIAIVQLLFQILQALDHKN